MPHVMTEDDYIPAGRLSSTASAATGQISTADRERDRRFLNEARAVQVTSEERQVR